MNKQFVEGAQKWKNLGLMSVGNITIRLYSSLTEPETKFLLFKEQA